MYNLIVIGGKESFSKTFEELEAARVISANEYTTQPLAERHGDLTGDTQELLMQLPCIYSNEASWDVDARVGWITKLQTRRAGVRFFHEYDDSIPPIPQGKLSELAWDLDLSDWEMNRTHWALKDVDLFEVLAEAEIISTELLSNPKPGTRIDAVINEPKTALDVQPSVFRIPDSAPDPKLVAVMMPFNADLDETYQTIGECCAELGLTCQRADEIFQENEVIQDIFSLIYRSAVVICDFTGRNPNVYYEVGIAHTLGRTVIPLTQNTEHVSFDVQHHRFISYVGNGEGLRDLQPKLQARLKTILRI